MSYKYETGQTSPNSTSAADTPAVFGRPRTIEAIVIHWWGDPNTNPSYEGVIATLCNPAREASAHFVATGTGRRVAQLVDFDRTSWASNSANPYTVSIECDPRCRDEDYDVVAELISQIRDAYGDLPLYPHRQFVATACPGNYDLGRLDSLARTKDGSGDWGDVKNKEAPKPEEPTYDNLYRLIIDGAQVGAYSTDENAYSAYIYYNSRGSISFKGNDVTGAVLDKFKPKPTEPEPEIPEVPEEPVEEPETPDEPSVPDNNNKGDSMKDFFRSLFTRKFLLVLGTVVTLLANGQYTEAVAAMTAYVVAEGGADIVQRYQESKQ